MTVARLVGLPRDKQPTFGSDDYSLIKALDRDGCLNSILTAEEKERARFPVPGSRSPVTARGTSRVAARRGRHQRSWLCGCSGSGGSNGWNGRGREGSGERPAETVASRGCSPFSVHRRARILPSQGPIRFIRLIRQIRIPRRVDVSPRATDGTGRGTVVPSGRARAGQRRGGGESRTRFPIPTWRSPLRSPPRLMLSAAVPIGQRVSLGAYALRWWSTSGMANDLAAVASPVSGC